MNPEEAEAALMAAVERNYRVITLTREGAKAAVRAAYRAAVVAELEALPCQMALDDPESGECRARTEPAHRWRGEGLGLERLPWERVMWCDRCKRIAELQEAP